MIELMGHETSERELFQIVESVTDTFLKLPAVAAPPPGEGRRTQEEVWTGTVAISGGFNGCVELACTREFAHKAARTVFGEDYPVDDAFARDVLAELTNIMGGNLKCLFSGMTSTTCSMSIPSVTTAAVLHPDATLLTELWADCESHLIAISIFEANQSPAHAR